MYKVIENDAKFESEEDKTLVLKVVKSTVPTTIDLFVAVANGKQILKIIKISLFLLFLIIFFIFIIIKMNIKKKLQNMNLSDLHFVCRELGISCPKNKNSTIIKLLKPLHKPYRMNTFIEYVAPTPYKPVTVQDFEKMKNLLQRNWEQGNSIYYITPVKDGELTEQVKLKWNGKMPHNINDNFVFFMDNQQDLSNNTIVGSGHLIPFKWDDFLSGQFKIRTKKRGIDWEFGSPD